MKNLRVFDFSARLPGPLAGHILAQKGIVTYKVEDTQFPDPFSEPSLQQLDPIFKVWYEKINGNKKLIRGSIEEIKQLVFDSMAEQNIFLCSNHGRLKQQLGSLPANTKAVFLEIQAGRGEDCYMHDLNALAQTPVFKLHLKQSSLPPFLPIAGVGFAQDIATQALFGVLELTCEQPEIFRTALLKESTQNIFEPLWDNSLSIENQYLHTGRFPCYRIYQAQDCQVAVAAVEEKFWNKFTQTFDLPLSSEDRLSSDPEIAKIVEQRLKEYKRQDLQNMALGLMCLTII